MLKQLQAQQQQYTYPIHNSQIHPHREHSRGEVNPLGYVHEELVVETLNPICISALMSSTSDIMIKQKGNYPAKRLGFLVDVGVQQLFLQPVNGHRVSQLCFAGFVIGQMAWRRLMTLGMLAL